MSEKTESIEDLIRRRMSPEAFERLEKLAVGGTFTHVPICPVCGVSRAHIHKLETASEQESPSASPKSE